MPRDTVRQCRLTGEREGLICEGRQPVLYYLMTS
jgi:hypothetical protein